MIISLSNLSGGEQTYNEYVPINTCTKTRRRTTTTKEKETKDKIYKHKQQNSIMQNKNKLYLANATHVIHHKDTTRNKSTPTQAQKCPIMDA